MSLSVILPYPPTANNLFPTGKTGKRFPSSEYKAWRKAAGLLLNTQKPHPVPPPYSFIYEFRRPDNRRRDLDNLTKAVNDLLVDAEVIEDDCRIEEMTLRWVHNTPFEARVTVSQVVT